MAYDLDVTIGDRNFCEKTAAQTYINIFDFLFREKFITDRITIDFPSIAKKNKEEWSRDKREDAVKLSGSNSIYISHHSGTREKKDQLQNVFRKYNIPGIFGNAKNDGTYGIREKDVEYILRKEVNREIKSDSKVTTAKNQLTQALCIIGNSGVGKTIRIKKTLEAENHKTLFVILDNMWQHILVDYSPEDKGYKTTKIGDFILKAQEDDQNNYTIVFDECHKSLETINDVLLQAISTKRNEGVRFISLNSLVDKFFDKLPEQNGNRVLPDNLGFVFISSKANIIDDNDDFRNRIETIELTMADRNNAEYSIQYLLDKIVKEEPSEYTN